MNLTLLDTKILQLINQYSINGSLTPSESNQDYLLKTRNLIDTCQKELANVFPIIKVAEFIQVAANNPTDFTSYPLPEKYDTTLSVYLKKYPTYKIIPYTIQGNNMLINPLIDGTIILNYTKIPNDITVDTAATTELEIKSICQELIPYYVGGWIYLEDNPTIATMLLNEYESKKNRIKNILPASSFVIEDVSMDFM